ncbi:MAG TPA: TolC family protein [Gemmataceae bacterium]|jgi:outer membrane protein TolC|nr:TolC family protein [Gemmataceae bacterium]
MRWKLVIAGLALMAAAANGCKQPGLTFEADLQHYRQMSVPNLETDPNPAGARIAGHLPAPSTINDPDRKPRPLTLAEAIAMGLENGNIGNQAVNSPGVVSDNLVTFQGRDVGTSDNIRVLRLDPAIAGSDIESALSKFDALYTSSLNWNVTDQPLQGLNQFNNGELATLSNSILKPLPTGGVAGITFSTQYQTLTNPPLGFTLINPAYSPSLQFAFEQPLLQGFGVEINQLRQAHPNSILTPFASTVRAEGVLISRVKYDQTRVEFERTVDVMLLNIETAYWNLYDSYWALYSREQGLRQAYEAYKINRLRYEAGKVATQDLAQSTRQYESFRSQRVGALGAVLESERQLRNLLNLPAEDGTRLIPVDPPTLTPYQPDWTTAVNEAMALRPELILARNDLKLRQFDLINAKNLLLPDLRFTSTYALAGIGSRLDGGDGNAFRSLAANDFQSWSLGLRFTMPIGFRDAHAQERVARLNLVRAYNVVEEQELRCQRALEFHYRRLQETYAQIGCQRSLRQAAALELEARTKEYLAGRGTLDFLLEAQSVWADALRGEYDFIVQYNNTLAAFEFDKGTMLRYDNVNIGEGPLPPAAQVRAVEHEKERSHAIVLRQHEIGVETLPTTGLPNLGKDPAPISAVLDDKPIPELNAPITMDAKSTNLNPNSSTSSALPLPGSSSATTLPPASAVPPATSSGYPGLLTPGNPPSAGFLPGNNVKLP